LSCQRQLNDLKRQDTKEFPYVFDHDLANRVCEFIELLPHIKGKWAKKDPDNPTAHLLKLEDWQCFIETTLFGWVHKDTGLRRFTQDYEEIPRKNAKSTKCAARALYLFSADKEEGAEVYTAATSRDQAKIVFNDARMMAKKSPDFIKHLGVNILTHNLSVEESSSKLAPLAADSDNLDGLNVHGAVVDELHAHKKRDLYDVLESATGARDKPLISNITTAGTDLDGICYEIRDYSILILNGVKDGSFFDESVFCIIYTIDKNDDWQDQEVWKKANPNYNVSVNPDDLINSAKKAAHSERAKANFLTKRLNVWVSSKSAWMNIDKWKACGNPELKLEDFHGKKCRISFDLASKLDFAAKNYLFYEDDIYTTFTKLYYPEDQIEQLNKREKNLFSGWVNGGFITLTSGEIIDFGFIEDDLIQDKKDFQVIEVPYDPFQATQFATRMMAEGFEMIQFGATVKNFSEPMKELEALIIDKKIQHDQNQVMNWMIGNVVAQEDKKENIFPNKEKKTKKIDGVIALIMNVGRYFYNENEQHAYTERGFISL
jgi:phage terminase large subunit-like protein